MNKYENFPFFSWCEVCKKGEILLQKFAIYANFDVKRVKKCEIISFLRLLDYSFLSETRWVDWVFVYLILSKANHYVLFCNPECRKWLIFSKRPKTTILTEPHPDKLASINNQN